MYDAASLDMPLVGDSVEGWVRFEDVGLLLNEPGYANGYSLVPLDASGWFDSVKNWVKKAAKTVSRVAKKALTTVKKGVTTALDSSIGKAALNAISMIPGYGTVIAGGLGALNSALKGGSISKVL